MRFFLFLIAFSLGLSSCQSQEEECRRYRDGRCEREQDNENQSRTKRKARAIDREDRGQEDREDRRAERAPEPIAAPGAKEKLIFPARLKTGHSALSLASSDNSAFKMSISAEPQSLPVSLIAGLSGNISLSTNEGSHILILSSASKKLYFELNEENSKLMASNSQNVSQGQVLAETKSPIIFYVKENEELTAICLSFEELGQNLKLINSFPSHPNCQQ